MKSQQSQKRIHFICRGNTFRSRLAAALFNSLMPADEWAAISSGVNATDNLQGDTAPRTIELLAKHQLTEFDPGHWTQTTQALIDESDLNIYLSPDVVAEARRTLDIESRPHRFWNVTDIWQRLGLSERDPINPRDPVTSRRAADAVYGDLSTLVLKLVAELKSSSSRE